MHGPFLIESTSPRSGGRVIGLVCRMQSTIFDETLKDTLNKVLTFSTMSQSAERYGMTTQQRLLSSVGVGAAAAGAEAVGALAIGAFALGAITIGALAIGRLAAHRVTIRKSRLHSLEIDDLTVGRLRVGELFIADAPVVLNGTVHALSKRTYQVDNLG